jgi:hypothetical protein
MKETGSWHCPRIVFDIWYDLLDWVVDGPKSQGSICLPGSWTEPEESQACALVLSSRKTYNWFSWIPRVARIGTATSEERLGGGRHLRDFWLTQELQEQNYFQLLSP